MNVNYQHTPEPGTIIHHNPAAPDILHRFYAIGDDGSTLRLADAKTEVYTQSQAGNSHPPRSVIEHYILRRVWTPYGYAKVWGHTPLCTPLEHPRSSLDAMRMEDLARVAHASRQRCDAWWAGRRPTPKPRPEGRDYMKKVNELYNLMAKEIDAGN